MFSWNHSSWRFINDVEAVQQNITLTTIQNSYCDIWTWCCRPHCCHEPLPFWGLEGHAELHSIGHWPATKVAAGAKPGSHLLLPSSPVSYAPALLLHLKGADGVRKEAVTEAWLHWRSLLWCFQFAMFWQTSPHGLLHSAATIWTPTASTFDAVRGITGTESISLREYRT
jgi:hypothetical protein